MARPRKTSKQKVKREHARCTSMRDLARRLDVTPPTAYNYCFVYNLPIIRGEPGTKPRLFTDEQFEEVYARADTVKEMADELGASIHTIRYHLRKNNLASPAVQEPEDHSSLFNNYRGLVQVNDLAEKYKVSRLTVRSRLKRYLIEHHPDGYPNVEKLSDIKIINELIRNDDLYDDPETIAEITGLSGSQVIRYMRRMWAEDEEDEE